MLFSFTRLLPQTGNLDLTASYGCIKIICMIYFLFLNVKIRYSRRQRSQALLSHISPES